MVQFLIPPKLLKIIHQFIVIQVGPRRPPKEFFFLFYTHNNYEMHLENNTRVLGLEN